MINTTTRMTFTIGEEIEARHGYWSALAVQICPVCEEAFPAIVDTNPGSTAEAIGAIETCEKCSKTHGYYILSGEEYNFINYYDKYPEVRDFERLLWKLENMEEESKSTPFAELEYEFIAELVELRQSVTDFREDIVQLLEHGYGLEHLGMGVEEDDHDYTDLDKEKWDNYWGDYNQCGIHICR